MMAIKWDEWRGDLLGRPTMRIKTLIAIAGRKVDLHKFVAADAADCFHTHPATAVRVVLWNGYVEELEDGTRRTWWPGRIGIVRPALSHRIAELRNGKPSYSLWLRGRKTAAKIELRGKGWTQ